MSEGLNRNSATSLVPPRPPRLRLKSVRRQRLATTTSYMWCAVLCWLGFQAVLAVDSSDSANGFILALVFIVAGGVAIYRQTVEPLWEAVAGCALEDRMRNRNQEESEAIQAANAKSGMLSPADDAGPEPVSVADTRAKVEVPRGEARQQLLREFLPTVPSSWTRDEIYEAWREHIRFPSSSLANVVLNAQSASWDLETIDDYLTGGAT